MLYIFKTGDGIAIAWGSKAPVRQPESRVNQLDTRRPWLRFIRTGNSG
ncbi:hypothetical protein [Rhizobium sp. SL86]|jgi:hypothetical protein|nr:hypothetical protein [Rhizobium sp. SL86]MCY1669110.1 hypothetical protein [Rhizobium sp. SL86]